MALLFLAAQVLLAPPPAVTLPQITREPACDRAASGDEIVVCGRSESSRYRIPPEFRDRGPIDDRHQARSNQVRDFNVLERFGSQTVGTGGYLQGAIQRDCQWRAARQEAQGRAIDCTRRIRPDEATDWQRR